MIRSIGAAALTAAVIIPVALGAGEPAYWPYYAGPMHDGIWPAMAMLWMLLFWTLAAVGAYTIVRWIIGRRPDASQGAVARRAIQPDAAPDEKAVRSDT